MKLFLRRAAGPVEALQRRLDHHDKRSGGWWLLWGVLVASSVLGVTEARAQDYDVRFVATGLNKPVGLAASASGDSDTLYFTEVAHAAEQGLGINSLNTVSKLTISTGDIAVLNRGDPQPTNIVQDAQGNLYWTSRAPGLIMMQSPSGSCAPLLWGLNQPVGLAIDATSQNLYYTELPTPGVFPAQGGENKVWQFNFANQFRTLLNTYEPAPTDIVVAKNGDLYFTCQSAGVIVWEPAGTPAEKHTIWAGFNSPMGIALDPAEENLYYTEVPTPNVDGDHGGKNGIYKLNLATQAISVVHTGDPLPNSLAVTPNGNIYWTCTTAGVIREAKAKVGN
jgi:sugar lactone lactonase YvrE